MQANDFKFLAFDKKCQSIHKVITINFSDNSIVCKGLKFLDSDIILNSREYELMPFTTLTDLKGNEIYAGHIVKCSGGSYPAEVVWYKGMWALETYRKETRNNFLESYYLDECEIIGNKYQNEDLLK